MSDTHDVHQLVIRNLAVLEQAPAIVEEAEKRIFGAIDRKVEDWAEAQGGWHGTFDFLERDTFFKPEDWPETEDHSLICLELGYAQELDCQHYLSPLVGAAPQEFGLRFNVHAPWITGLEGQKRAQPGKKWASFLQSVIDDFPALAANGFRIEGELLFHPIRLDAAALADAYPDTLDDALEPVDEALAHLAAALPEFNRLIEAAQSHFTPQSADAPQPG
ncbi:MAG: hypothetical protein PHW25_08365 [Zoogloea sp.]|uniref:hypothetical protein n=1 Tax=Zoogloea sp. TaxID=49181 RepID=UPI002637A228|nr:hypothetical protein [Zoogloea sp.]MDD3327083.1 hypothetical protein [Zoogloea sp.]